MGKLAKEAEEAKLLEEFIEHLDAFSDATEQGDDEEADNQYAYLFNMYSFAIHKKLDK